MKTSLLLILVMGLVSVTAVQSEDLERVPVEMGGRIMPLGTAAKLTLLECSNQTTWQGDSALEFFRMAWIDPEAWGKEEFLMVKNPGVFAALGKSVSSSGRLSLSVLDGPVVKPTDETAKELLRLKAVGTFAKNWSLTFTPGSSSGLALVPGSPSWLTPWQALESGDPVQRELGQLWLYWDFSSRSGQAKEADETLKVLLAKTSAHSQGGRVSMTFWEALVQNLPMGPLLFAFSLAALLATWFFPKRRGLVNTLSIILILFLSALIVLRSGVAGFLTVNSLQGHVLFIAWFSTLLSLAQGKFHLGIPLIILVGWLLAPEVEALSPLNPGVWNVWLFGHFLIMDLGFALTFTAVFGEKVLREKLLPWGLFVLGVGIYLGMIWSDWVWGVFWSWDPRETANLVLFLLLGLGCFLQARRTVPELFQAVFGYLALVPLLFALLWT